MSETEIADDELYEMVNLVPHMTGLPMTVWARPRGGARHDVSIKVNLTHGPQMDIGNTAVIAVRPTPHWVAGPQLSPSDMRAVSQWIGLNQAALIAYWDFQIYTDEFLRRLQPLSPPVPP